MSDQTDPADNPDPGEPIDADFEPAPKDPPVWKRAFAGGPGWTGAIVLSLIAACLGGGIGLTGNLLRTVPASTEPVDISAELAPVAERQKILSEQIERTARDVQKLGEELRTEMAALPTGEAGAVTLPDDLDTRLAALSSRLDTMASQARLESLESKVDVLESIDTDGQASAAEVVRAVSALEGRMDRMEADLSEARTQMTAASAASSRDIDKLMTLIDDMRRDEATARSEAAAADASADAAIALSAVEAASRFGRPFENEYRMLLAAFPQSENVRQLEAIAGQGAPTLAELQEDFEAPLKAARQAIPIEGGSLSWLDSMFGEAVTVRRVEGDASGVAEVLETAELALASGELESCLAALAPLEGPVADAFADWTVTAKRRITLEAALSGLRLDLIAGGQNQE